jgi:hypothetical protein
VLDEAGVSDFSVYRIDKTVDLWSDYFIPDATPIIEPMEFPDIPHNHGKVSYKNSMA